MKKAIIYAPNDVRIEDLPDQQPGPHDVVIRLMVSSICYTDVKIFNGTHNRGYPIGFGHDAAGYVEAVGSAVARFKPGDLVVTEQFLGCGRCAPCLRGRTDLCLEQPSFYAGGKYGGWFGEKVVYPADHVLPLPAGVTLDDGATIEPLLTALQAHRVARYAPGSTVVVVGAGPMGWGQIQVAKRVHGCRVIAVDVLPNRLALARAFGADETIDAGREDVAARVAAFCGPAGPDVVIETVGSAEGLDLASSLCGMGGTLIIIGATGTLTVPELVQRGVQVNTIRGGAPNTRGGFVGVRQEALGLIADGTLDFKPAISHRFPLDRLTNVLMLLMGDRSQLNKIVIDH